MQVFSHLIIIIMAVALLGARELRAGDDYGVPCPPENAVGFANPAAFDALGYVRMLAVRAKYADTPLVLAPVPIATVYPVWVLPLEPLGEHDNGPVKVSLTEIGAAKAEKADAGAATDPPTQSSLYVAKIAFKGDAKPSIVASGRRGDGLAGTGTVMIKDVVTIKSSADLNNAAGPNSATTANVRIVRIDFSNGTTFTALGQAGFAVRGIPGFGTEGSLQSGGGFEVAVPTDKDTGQKIRFHLVLGPGYKLNGSDKGIAPSVNGGVELMLF
ncbi:MAG: hypothetical protein HY075_06285 [Deltaproteobacteria bacterium]|nr:hypothetical protein [Deltaproteobacteria bacterium]